MVSQPNAASVRGTFLPSYKIELSETSFLTHVLPAFTVLYLMGVLVQLNGTRFYRLALLPVALLLAWRAALIDISGGDPSQVHMNSGIVAVMFVVAMRYIIMAFAREPYRRKHEITSQKQSRVDSDVVDIYTALWDGCELMVNARGFGWNWQRGFKFSRPIFETDSRITFIAWSLLKLGFYLVAVDVLFQTIRKILPVASDATTASLFDPSLPPLLDLFRALVVSSLGLLAAFFVIESGYQTSIIVPLIVFQQQPSQWPPLFDAPWLSTSLADFWGHRWHQMMRHMLVHVGAPPFNVVFGRAGGVIGAFLLSGIFHDIIFQSFGRGGYRIVTIFFLMSGVGVLLERAWQRVTGRSVGGVWGRLWTFGWLALWGVPMVDIWMRKGMFELVRFPPGFEPSVILVSSIRRWI